MESLSEVMERGFGIRFPALRMRGTEGREAIPKGLLDQALGDLLELPIGLQKGLSLGSEGGTASVPAALSAKDQGSTPFLLQITKDLPAFAVRHAHPLTSQTYRLRLLDEREQFGGAWSEKGPFSDQAKPQFRKDRGLRGLKRTLEGERRSLVLNLQGCTGKAAAIQNFVQP